MLKANISPSDKVPYFQTHQVYLAQCTPSSLGLHFVVFVYFIVLRYFLCGLLRDTKKGVNQAIEVLEGKLTQDFLQSAGKHAHIGKFFEISALELLG